MLRHVFHGLLCVALLTGNVWAQTSAPAVRPAVRNDAHLPLAFARQGDGSRERFVAHGQGYVIGLDAGKTTILVPSAEAVSLAFVGSRSVRAVVGPELPGKVNYIRGNDPRKWQIGLPAYARIAYPETYPGIDVVYYGNQQQLEFDLLVKPGADPEAIRLKIGGAGKLSIDASGALVLGEPAGGLRIALPQIFQEVNGEKKSVPGHYAIAGADEVAFKVNPFDHTRPLVIDPSIVYSTLFGGGLGSNGASGIGLDSNGNVIIAGYTYAADFPTLDAAQNGLKGNETLFITKINPSGTAFLYSTYFGGSSVDFAAGLAVDSTGAAWVTGSTYSADFPVLNAAYATNGSFEGGFVARFNSEGVLQFSTFLGGNNIDYGTAIAVDSLNNGYVTGFTSGSFPTTAGVFDTTNPDSDAFVTKYSPSGAVVYSTFLGGGNTSGSAIAVDSSGDAYVTGHTYDSTFTGAPAGGAQTTNSGGGDAFVAKLNPTATAMLYFTFLGGAGYDYGTAIAVDTLFNAYIAGGTNSTGLAKTGAAQLALPGAANGFAAKLNPAGSEFTYVTYLGGSRVDNLSGLALDGSGNVYLAGTTDSANFPTVSPLQPTLPGSATSLFNSTNSGGSWAAFDSNIPGAVLQLSVNAAGTSSVVLTESGIYRTANSGGSWTQQLAAVFSSNNGDYIARSPVAAGTLYLSSCCTNVYQSTNDGVTWTQMGTASGAGQINGILADPLTANTVYIFGNNSPYIFKSTDGGKTWNSAATGLPGAQYNSIVTTMAATTDGSLYAGTTGSGIYKSTNQGGSWAAVNTGLPANVGAGGYSLSASGTTVYFSNGFVYVTTNGGASWAASPAGYLGAEQVAASPQNASIVYALIYNNSVQESTNGGTTWSSPETGLPSDTYCCSSSEVVVDPTNSAHVLAVVPVNQAGFVAKLNNTGSALTWSTYLGGTTSTGLSAVATDGAGNAFVTGYTYGGGFPVTSVALAAGSSNILENYNNFKLQTYNILLTKISDATAACSTLAVSPGSALASQYGGTLTFAVTAPSGCAWSASSDGLWAPVTGGASGTGSGIVSVQITYNSGGEQSATLTVGGQNVTITQPSSSCVYLLDQTSYPVAVGGGTFSAVLTASAGCPWIVTNPYSSAVSITSNASGTGNGTIGMTVVPNLTGKPLTFYLAVGTTQIQISQAGNVGAQTVTFDEIPNQILGVGPFPIAAKASSGLPVGFMSTTPTVCRTAAALVIPLRAVGTCSITASQPGNGTYTAASVTRSFTISAANPSGSFKPAAGSPITVGSGSYPASVATGDFNGDGVPDLAVANENNTVTILLGNGSGGFTPSPGSPFAVGSGPISLAAGDFNGDGILDLAIANELGNNVTVLVGNGLGGFTPGPGSPFAVGTPFAAASNPYFVVVGDFNGDGIQDLATANGGGGSITIFLGIGSGEFTAATASPFTIGSAPVFLAVGDFNGDGIQDLAVTSQFQDSVTVLLGNGSGGFTAAMGSPFAVGAQPLGLAVGNFNGDNFQDLVAVGSDNLAVLLGNGSGGFAAATNIPLTAGTNATSVVVGDFNGDGFADLATANRGSNNITVLLGNGSGGFSAATGSPFAVGTFPDSLAVADFNGDGIEDLATANNGDGTVTVLLGAVVGSAPQTITFGPLSSVTYGVSPFTVSATSTSGLAVSLASATSYAPAICTVSGNTVTIIGGGTCSIIASQAGNATYAAAATVMQSFTVNQASQTVIFGILADQILGSSPPPLSAIASSGLGVTFTSNTPSVCTVSGVNITLIAVGKCSITASQPGNSDYAPETPVTQTFTVSASGIQPVAGFLDQMGAPALTFNGSTNFPDAGGFLIGAPGVTQDLYGNAYVVGLDSAGGVHMNSYSFANSSWNGWQYSGGILDTTSGLTAAVAPNGVIWFTGRDIGNRFWINSWNGTSFGGWILVADGIFAPTSVPQIAIPSDGTIYVIGKDIGGRIWSNSYNPTNQTFTGWVDRQAVMIGQPSATAGQDGMVYVAVRSVSSGSPVYITQIPAQNAATANTWLNGGGLIDTDPQITSQDGTVYLTAVAGGGTVYLLTFAESNQTYGTWTFTNGVLNDATIAAAAGSVFIAGRDSGDRIYWYSVTGNNWSFVGGAGISSTVLTGAK
jgi:hypothetical protein